MNDLLARIIDAHGGVDRWKKYENRPLLEMLMVSIDISDASSA